MRVPAPDPTIRWPEPDMMPLRTVAALLLTLRMLLAPSRAIEPPRSSGLLPARVTEALLRVIGLVTSTPPVTVVESVPLVRLRPPAVSRGAVPATNVPPSRLIALTPTVVMLTAPVAGAAGGGGPGLITLTGSGAPARKFWKATVYVL